MNEKFVFPGFDRFFAVYRSGKFLGISGFGAGVDDPVGFDGDKFSAEVYKSCGIAFDLHEIKSILLGEE